MKYKFGPGFLSENHLLDNTFIVKDSEKKTKGRQICKLLNLHVYGH